MSVMFGGPKARKQRISRGFVCSEQYVNGEEAIVIWPLRKRSLDAGAYVMCLSAAYKYEDPAYLMRQARTACEVMRMFPDKATVVNLATVLDECREDLLKMLPEPDEHAIVLGSGEVKVDGRSFSFDVTDKMLVEDESDGVH